MSYQKRVVDARHRFTNASLVSRQEAARAECGNPSAPRATHTYRPRPSLPALAKCITEKKEVVALFEHSNVYSFEIFENKAQNPKAEIFLKKIDVFSSCVLLVFSQETGLCK